MSPASSRPPRQAHSQHATSCRNWFLIRHPLLEAAAGLVILTWAKAGWPGVVVLANVTVASLVTLRLWRPEWFARLVTVPLRCRWCRAEGSGCYGGPAA
ncbi:MAG TPA: hypothetical protein VF933_29615, partial [Streptosporangiaceae bacterium]